MTPTRGSQDNPLTGADLPFVVPEEGRYWIRVGNRPAVELPVAPKGAVLELQIETRRASLRSVEGALPKQPVVAPETREETEA